MADEQEIGRAWIENRLRDIACARGLHIELSCFILTSEEPEFKELPPTEWLFVVKAANRAEQFTVLGATLDELANHTGEQARMNARMREVIGRLRHGPTS